MNNWVLQDLEFFLDLSHLLVHFFIQSFLLLLKLMDRCPSELQRLINTQYLLVDFIKKLCIPVRELSIKIINFLIFIVLIIIFFLILYVLIVFLFLLLLSSSLLLLLIFFTAFTHYQIILNISTFKQFNFQFPNTRTLRIYTLIFKVQELLVIYMHIITKRQKFASQQRQKHREQIFKKHRQSSLAEQHRLSGLVGNATKNYEFIFATQIRSIELTSQGIEQYMKNGELERILQVMPKWIITLSQSMLAQSNPQTVLHPLLNILLYCLKSNRLILIATSCLVQLTSLPVQFLKSMGIVQEELAQQFNFIIYGILLQSSDMQIIFNCVYISGNLYESFRYFYMKQNFGEAEKTKNEGQIYEMQTRIIGKMMQICNMYPNYENCLEVMLWYMKNSIIVSNISKNRRIKESKNKNQHMDCEQPQKSIDTIRQVYFISILEKIILFLSSKFSGSNLGTDKEYYEKILYQAFYLLNIIVSDPQLYYHEAKFTETKTVFQMKKHVRQILSSIDLSISTFISNFLSKELSPSIIQKPHKKRQTLPLISQILEQILFYLPNIKNYHDFFPKSIQIICFLVAEGKIKCPKGVSLCTKTLEICINNNVPDLFQLGRAILKKYIKNILSMFGEKDIIADRQYRVQAMKMFEQIEDLLNYSDLRGIVNQIINQSSPKKNEMSQQPRLTKQALHNVYEQYLLSKLLPPILNIIDLLLIDEASQNRSMGIKIIYKLTTNWQINTTLLRSLLIDMDLGERILEMQDEKEETIYSFALDLIQELQLDEEWV